MGAACTTNGGDKGTNSILVEYLKAGNHLGATSTEGRAILKSVLRKYEFFRSGFDAQMIIRV